MRKIIFLDIDGTLVNDNGVIPESARVAVQKARENNHLVFLCTGRSKSEIFTEIIQVGFDGIIGAAGGYIEYEEKVLSHNLFMVEDIEYIINYFNENQIDFYLESNSGLYASEYCKNHLQDIITNAIANNPKGKAEIESGFMPFFDTLIEGKNLLRNDINKISFLGSQTPIEDIIKKFNDDFTIIPSTISIFGENSGELSLKGIHKATAIEKLLTYLKIDKEHSLAFGDGLNDIEMIRYVHHGIAMGNAQEAVKNVADDVTDTPNEDGIYKGFKKYNLI